MAESVTNSYFPSQTADDKEKASHEYGLKVSSAIEREWFNGASGSNKYASTGDSFHLLRLYARGEQPIGKYKDELSINGDLSYLNLDWKPVPIISKFVDIVVNGISERAFQVKTFTQDQHGMNKRSAYMKSVLKDMRSAPMLNAILAGTNINLYENNPAELPGSKEELDLHMQLNYKQGVEIAAEQAINVTLADNRYDDVKKRITKDLTVIGIGAVKHNFNESTGVEINYVDPANLVYSATDSPYFEDIYYVGEVKEIPVNELMKIYPDMDLSEIDKSSRTSKFGNGSSSRDRADNNFVKVLYFNYKTFANEVYKLKTTGSGGSKIIKKDDTFNPPVSETMEYSKLSRSIEVVYEGVKVVGSDVLLEWGVAENMTRPKSDSTKVRMNYSICAPSMYRGKIESLVGRVTGFADMIQLTHLKLQQVLSRMVPDGVYLDADGLSEIDLGNGTNYNPQEALNMFFQTGSVIGRSMTADGELNHGKVPIQELQSGAGSNKINVLVNTYNYYLQMIRDVTGLNEARDGSTPDERALVGVQKIAAANSNTATRHILNAGLLLTAELVEGITLRIADIIEYAPAKEAFIQKIGAHNVGILEELNELHIHDFGIFLELVPDEEEKALLENNIQVALAQQGIDLEDAIDIREVRNLKLANQLLKLRRKQKHERDQQAQQQNIQAQSQANMQAQQAAAQLDIQKQQAIGQVEAQLEQMKAQLDSQKLSQEGALKKELMEYEFQLNMQLRQMEAQTLKGRDDQKEDRKDKRTKLQASQQSELIDQRKNNKPPKDFESSGNDILGGGFGLGSFDPK
jgi:hypothetical protein